MHIGAIFCNLMKEKYLFINKKVKILFWLKIHLMLNKNSIYMQKKKTIFLSPYW